MFLASFYGASYISYPLQEAKGITDISFRFRTHLSDALLLLAAGKTDYCMVSSFYYCMNKLPPNTKVPYYKGTEHLSTK